MTIMAVIFYSKTNQQAPNDATGCLFVALSEQVCSHIWGVNLSAVTPAESLNTVSCDEQQHEPGIVTSISAAISTALPVGLNKKYIPTSAVNSTRASIRFPMWWSFTFDLFMCISYLTLGQRGMSLLSRRTRPGKLKLLCSRLLILAVLLVFQTC